MLDGRRAGGGAKKEAPTLVARAVMLDDVLLARAEGSGRFKSIREQDICDGVQMELVMGMEV